MKPLEGKTPLEFLDMLDKMVLRQGKMTFLYNPDRNLVCRNTPTERQPSRCIIGEFAHQHGIADTTMSDWDYRRVIEVLGGSRTIEIIAKIVQLAQDNGTTWGSAIALGRIAVLLLP